MPNKETIFSLILKGRDMKKLLIGVLSVMSFSVLASGPELQNISKGDLEDVGKEFAANFSHTAVAAPETDGAWGLEVGLVASRTKSPAFADVVDDAGEDGSDFKNIYNAGLMARAHFPLDLFAELTYLPQTEISEVKVKSKSFSLGWNAGGFFGLPLDLAAGLSFSSGDVSFKQDISVLGVAFPSTVSMETKSRILWAGASKTFFTFLTPYAKLGVARTEADVDVKSQSPNASVFSSGKKHENVDSSGAYMALGANLQFLLFRFGLEGSRIVGVNKISGKLSVDF